MAEAGIVGCELIVRVCCSCGCGCRWFWLGSGWLGSGRLGCCFGCWCIRPLFRNDWNWLSHRSRVIKKMRKVNGRKEAKGGTSKLREGEEGARERKGPGETEGREEIKRVAWAGYKYPTKKSVAGRRNGGPEFDPGWGRAQPQIIHSDLRSTHNGYFHHRQPLLPFPVLAYATLSTHSQNNFSASRPGGVSAAWGPECEY